jgi:peptidoglycan/LPS O-acetylase OafA/YrhL
MNSRIRGADGFRAIACMMVIYHHVMQRLDPIASPTWVQVIQYMGMRGEVGVSIFFVLSGCLLATPFWNAFIGKTPQPKMRTYFQNRAARILPAYYLILILSTFLAVKIIDFEIVWSRIVSGVFLVSHFHWNTFFASELDPPLWTITLEIWSYILLPIVLFSIFWKARTVKAAAIGMGIWIVFLQSLQPLLIKYFMTDDYGKGWDWGWAGGAKLWLPYWNLASFFTQFLLGASAALYISHRKSKGTQPSKKYDLLSLAAILVAFVLIQVRLIPGVPDAITRQPYISPLYAAIVAFALATVPFSTFLANFLEMRFFKRVATLSFGLYLWHYMIMQIWQNKMDDTYYYYGTSNLGRWADSTLIVILLTWVFAEISWRFFESPILRKSRNNIDKRERNQLPSL